MKEKRLSQFTKYCLDFMFYTGILVTIMVPVLFRFFGRYFPNVEGENYVPMCVIFMVCGVLAIWIIYYLRKIFSTILKEDCFVEENVTALKRMGIASFFISIMFIVRLLFIVTLGTLTIILVFFIAGLFSLVLAQVFAQAVAYKKENDFTI